VALALGICSMALGILGLLLAVMPFVGVIGLPMSGLGVVFGVAGLITAFARQRNAIGFPVAGTAVSLAAVLMGGVWLYLLKRGTEAFPPGVTTGDMSRLFRNQYGGHPTEHWIHQLKDADPKARQEAVFALGVIGAEAEEAVPAVCKLLKDPEPRVRCDAALALLKMYPASRKTAPDLAGVLEDEMPLARINAAIALNRLALEARPAVPALLKALGDKRNDQWIPGFQITIREALLQALGRATAGSTDGVAVLSEALKDDSLPREMPPETRVNCRAAAARALGEVGPEAREAVPLLKAAAKEPELKLRDAAQAALKKIEPGRE
jgi:HEAT repeat protein